MDKPRPPAPPNPVPLPPKPSFCHPQTNPKPGPQPPNPAPEPPNPAPCHPKPSLCHPQTNPPTPKPSPLPPPTQPTPTKPRPCTPKPHPQPPQTPPQPPPNPAPFHHQTRTNPPKTAKPIPKLETNPPPNPKPTLSHNAPSNPTPILGFPDSLCHLHHPNVSVIELNPNSTCSSQRQTLTLLPPIKPPIDFIHLLMAANGEDFSQFDISTEEKNRLIAEVVRYVLFKTHQSSGCPIKREELTQIVTKNYRQRALPAAVINEAKLKLANVFGYQLKELQRSRPSTKNQTRSSQLSAVDAKSYVIMSKLPADVYRKYVEDISSAHFTGFTFVVVSIVHLAGGKISAENLWHHLRRMGLQETDESNPTIGNVSISLEMLVQQRYLQKDKVDGPEGNTLMYELAERALDGEVSEKIKEYISQIVNKDLGTVEIV